MARHKAKYNPKLLLTGTVTYTEINCTLKIFNLKNKPAGTYTFKGCKSVYDYQIKIHEILLDLFGGALPFIVNFDNNGTTLEAFSVEWIG